MNPTQERPGQRAATTGRDSRHAQPTAQDFAPQHAIDWQLVDRPPALRKEGELGRVLSILDEIEAERGRR